MLKGKDAVVSFDTLQGNYPTEDKTVLYNNLGGQWPSLIADPNYQNTCAIRLSVAFYRSGVIIPGAYKEAISGKGDNIIVKVKTMGEYVESLLGVSYWGMSKNPGSSVTPSTIPAKKGIIVYHAAWSNASGHFDLWTGSDFVGAGNFDDIKVGFDIELWDLSSF